MFSVGDRVAIDEGSKVGILRYLGPTKFRQGVWAGVELDEALGKNDGSVDGERYFYCPPDHGIFVHPSKLLFMDARRGSAPVHAHPLLPPPAKMAATAARPHSAIVRGNGVGAAAPLASTPISERRKKIALESGARRGTKTLPFMTPVKSAAPAGPPTTLMAGGGEATSYLANSATNPFHAVPSSQALPADGDAAAGRSGAPLDKYSLPAMEGELQRRAAAVREAKRALDEARLAIGNPQEVAEYEKNRDHLITLVDNYERCMNKYDRQLRRIGHLYKRHAIGDRHNQASLAKIAMESTESLKALSQAIPEVAKTASGGEGGGDLGRVRRAEARAAEAEENCVALRGDLEGAIERLAVAQEQLQYQLDIVARLNVDRGNLKRENADLKGKLESAFLNASEETDAMSKQAEETIQQLERENGELKARLSLLQGDKERLEVTMRETLDEVERTQDDTTQTASKLEVLINEKDAQIARLSHELVQSAEQLRREKEASNRQVQTLRDEIASLCETPSLDPSRHRAQVEALRQSLDENWRRYSADLAERDALIEDMRQQLDILAKPTRDLGLGSVSATLTALGVVDDGRVPEELHKVATELAGLQVRYAELYKSKMSQDRYYSSEIKKLKQRAAAKQQRATATDKKSAAATEETTTLFTANLENQLKDAQSELEHLKSSSRAEVAALQERITLLMAEQERLRSEKKLEAETLQRRLARVQNERDAAKQRLDQLLEVKLPNSQKEIETLRKELEDVKREKELLRESLESSTLSSSLELATSRTLALETQLNARTEELVRAETTVKEQTRTIADLTASMEHVKRELSSKISVHQTEMAISQRRISELQTEIKLLSGDRSRADLLRELEEYKQDCADARQEIDRLKNVELDDVEAGRLRRKINALLQDIATKDAKLEALQAVIDGFKQGAGEERLIEMLERDLEARNKEAETLSLRLRQAEETAEARFTEYEKQIGALQAEKTRLADEAQAVSLGRGETDKLLETLRHETLKREEAERTAKHQLDLIELAEEELKKLQTKLAQYEEAEQQRRVLATKYQTLKDESATSMQRIEAQTGRIRELEARLKEMGGATGPAAMASGSLSSLRSSSGERLGGAAATAKAVSPAIIDADAYQRLVEERDMALGERDHLQRMNVGLEHERRLLEAELASVKETLRRLKGELGISQQHELLVKAGSLIEELAETRQESWGVLSPFRSLASFMRGYKPTDVDVRKLQAEYESLRSTLEAVERGEDNPRPMAQANVPTLRVEQPHAKDENSVGQPRAADTCGICHRAGHTAVQCDNASDSEDPVGFTLSTFSSDDVRAFSA